jgi:hypothetical protein
MLNKRIKIPDYFQHVIVTVNLTKLSIKKDQSQQPVSPNSLQSLYTLNMSEGRPFRQPAIYCLFSFFWLSSPPVGQGLLIHEVSRSHTTTHHTTVGRTPLHECSARRRDLFLTRHDTQIIQTYMTQVGFENIISAGARPQTYASHRAATGTGFPLLTTSIQITKGNSFSNYHFKYEEKNNTDVTRAVH